MLASQSSLKCCLNASNVTVATMAADVTNQPIILTLNDNLSTELLEAKTNKDKLHSGNVSVELWIKSLNNTNEADDTKYESGDPSSDVDDLHLGAEATDLSPEEKRTSKSDFSPSNSEDNRNFSRSKKHFLFSRHRSYDRSLDSDLSARSSPSCVSSLLSARESDPEEVLKAAGFGTSSVIDHIPNRFLSTGTMCEGVNAEKFLSSIRENADDGVNTTSDHHRLPPWVMARADDIPRKFLSSTNLGSSSGGPGGNVLMLSESDEEQQGRVTTLSKVACSKLGTYLEPVSEEIEVSSQGTSVNMLLITPRDTSFESNRSSTLKADSREESVESGNKIPSLKDLWGSPPSTFTTTMENSDLTPSQDNEVVEQNEESSLNAEDSGTPQIYLDTEARADDDSEHIPGLMDYYNNDKNTNTTEAPVSFECESFVMHSDNEDESYGPHAMYNTSNVYNNANNSILSRSCDGHESTEYSSSLLNEPSDDRRAINVKNSQENYSRAECSRTENRDRKSLDTPNTLKMQNKDDTEPLKKDSNVKSQSNERPQSIAESVKKSDPNCIKKSDSRKSIINTSLATSSRAKDPGTKKAAPMKTIPSIVISDSSEPQRKISIVNPPDRSKLQPEAGGAGSKKNGSFSHRSQVSFLIDSSTGACVSIKSKQFSQINLSSNAQKRSSRAQNSGASYKISLMEKSRFPSQIVFSAAASAKNSIECFSKFYNNTVRKAPSLLRCQRSSGFCSLATQSDQVTESPPSEHARPPQGTPLLDKGDPAVKGVVREKEVCHYCGSELEKTTSLLKFLKTCNGETEKDTGLAVIDELNGLQSSLKGIKIYKAGIHLMQLASSVEAVIGSSDSRKPGSRLRSCQNLLDSIQNELKDSEDYILQLQKRLSKLKKGQKRPQAEGSEEKVRRPSDFSQMTGQLLREQLKMFTSITNSVSPSSTPSEQLSTEDSSSTSEEQPSDLTRLRKEIQLLRQESQHRHLTVKEEILSEVRKEIRNCFKEFVQK